MVASVDAPERMFGKAIKRREDPRLITGAAAFLDDIRLPGMSYAALLRSPHGHARIRSIDTSAAAAAPGVIGVFTGEDFTDLNPLPCAWQAGGVQNNVNTPRVLAVGEVHQVGDPIAVVVAEDAEAAADAVDRITVDYEVLPTVVDALKATQEGAPQLHENAPNNIVMHWTCGKGADEVRAAIDQAEIKLSQRIVNQRLIPNAMETRGSIGRYDPGTGEYTLWATSQAPHVMRLLITAFVMGIPEQKLRVISPDMGGGFGSKIFLYFDMPLTLALAKRVGRPVKYVEDRSENYMSTTHGRDHITDLEIGATRDGKIAGMNVTTYANMGGYLSTIAPGIPTTLYGRMLSGCYKVPNIHCDVYGVYTNTAMVDAYRGAGRPEAAFVIERTCDLVAGATGLDPAEVRRRNFIQPQDFPYDNGVGMLPYDSGNYEPALDRALDAVGYRELREEQKRRIDSGASKLLGIGLSSYVEVCGVAPSKWIGLQGEGWGAGLWESANVKVHLTGKVVVTTGSQPHGQGHETTFAQLVSDELGIPYDDIEVDHSDTLGAPFGYGTYGSRSLSVGGTAIFKSAGKIKEKARRITAHLLEANYEDIVYENGKCFVKGSPESGKTIQEIALAASVGYDLPREIEPFLDETTYYDPPNCTFPFGTHICVVEIDRDTGHAVPIKYIAVDDVGNVLNPLIVDGQVHGGIAQGLAQALYERAYYNDDGQLVTGTMSDYAVPKASMVPSYQMDKTCTPTSVNPMGVKGAGEAGTIAATPAVANAVIDGLKHLGVKHIDMPMTPERVWRAMNPS
ncbi:MAG TPA: xanthine dehydrogenase family protein molybdopterin-binding subunit [Thermomicrobiales bacterium]|nr:xanthine dehydrogenase family protein molybdopterin-binding subunit [Thermomicrobiales bacterium]